MSLSELERPSGAERRIRHDVRDRLLAAGVSLTASVGLTAVLWVAVWWLG